LTEDFVTEHISKAPDLEGADYGTVDSSVERSSPPRLRLAMALAFATLVGATFVVGLPTNGLLNLDLRCDNGTGHIVYHIRDLVYVIALRAIPASY
jgi:hypothetical protein